MRLEDEDLRHACDLHMCDLLLRLILAARQDIMNGITVTVTLTVFTVNSVDIVNILIPLLCIGTFHFTTCPVCVCES